MNLLPFSCLRNIEVKTKTPPDQSSDPGFLINIDISFILVSSPHQEVSSLTGKNKSSPGCRGISRSF